MSQSTEQEDLGGGASVTTIPAAGTSTATDVSIRDYFLALRAADGQLRQSDLRFHGERDRRYKEVGAANDRRLTEVAVEREKALKIKEEADRTALELERVSRDYKDEKANQLREQIGGERTLYATKDDLLVAVREVMATIKPLGEFVSRTQGRSGGIGDTLDFTRIVILLLIAAAGLYFGTH